METNWFLKIFTGLLQFMISPLQGILSFFSPAQDSSGGGIFSGIANLFKGLFQDNAPQSPASAEAVAPTLLKSYQEEAAARADTSTFGKIKRTLTRDFHAVKDRIAGKPPQDNVNFQSDFDFWMSKGYTPAQSAGIIANMKNESGGRDDARGDNGHAHGLFQWHEGRRAAIEKATGINVSTAGHREQLEAAAWEMTHLKSMFDDAHFRTLTSPDAAAAYFSKKFERPADTEGAAAKRGQTALALMRERSASGAPQATV